MLPAMSRPLFLHETVDIVGEGSVPYMQHVVSFDTAAGADRGLRLAGTFEVVGSTGRWPQVVNLWECVDGWDGWARLVRRAHTGRPANTPLAEWWREAYAHRSGGFDRLLGGDASSRSLERLVADRVAGELFVHELATLPPGTSAAYRASVLDQRAPLLARHGHELVGTFEVLTAPCEVVTIWATDVDAHVALGRARDAAAGLDDTVAADPALPEWEAAADALGARRREELLVPLPGTPLARKAA